MKLLERRRALMSALSKFIRVILGKPPLTLNACVDDKSTIDYKLYGESVQGLPKEYQQVEYIESTGTQYIDTGIVPNQDTGFDIEFLTKNAVVSSPYGGTSGYAVIFGGRQSSKVNELQLNTYSSDLSYKGTLRYGTTSNNAGITPNTKMHITFKGGQYTNDSDVDYYVAEQTFTSPSSIYMFALHNGSDVGEYGLAQIYNLKLYNGDILVRNFIPCYRKSDNVIGMYDLVEKKFYTNAGTGTFLKGSDIVPTPDAPIEVESVGEKTVNLFDINNMEYIHYGSSYFYPKVENGLFISPGKTGVSFYYMPAIKVEPSTTYVVSFKEVSGVNNRGIFLYDDMDKTNTISIYKSTFIDSTRIFTLTTSDTSNYLAIAVSGVNSYTAIISNIQIEKGDTFTNYEPYGKYKIPIVASGKNLFDEKKLTELGLTLQEDGRYYDYSTNSYILWENTSGIQGSLSIRANIEYLTQKGFELRTTYTDGTFMWGNGITNSSKTVLEVKLVNSALRETWISNVLITTDLSSTDYEPYQEPITTNIYLDEPLRKIGDYADYVDFENQKVVRNVKKVDLEKAGNTYSWIGKNGVTFAGALDKKYNRNNKALCNRNYRWTANGGETLTMWLGVESNSLFWIGILDYLGFTTLGEMNEWLINNPTYLLYGSDLPTETPVELPQLPTFKGTTIYSIDTNIQPSNMEVTYYSKERSVS